MTSQYSSTDCASATPSAPSATRYGRKSAGWLRMYPAASLRQCWKVAVCSPWRCIWSASERYRQWPSAGISRTRRPSGASLAMSASISTSRAEGPAADLCVAILSSRSFSRTSFLLRRRLCLLCRAGGEGATEGLGAAPSAPLLLAAATSCACRSCSSCSSFSSERSASVLRARSPFGIALRLSLPAVRNACSSCLCRFSI
mmetsp:Transcript_20059/g.46314  ORF Transcript_20059/g.46314 Transcript_20059/m.46314 type:complete len:201 (-) Transcript_20059:106-708(-)